MMNVVNAPLTATLLTTAFSKTNNTRNSKSSSSLPSEPTIQQSLTNRGLLSSFSILTSSPSSTLPKTETTKTNSTLHNPNNAMPFSSSQRQAPSSSSYELKIKMESVGAQPEQDDDLDMCPARTRAIWPRQLVPWWQPAQPHDKPPFSYATLIAYSILISQDGRLLLNDIYQWISDTYPYYNLEQRGWQNSIRHNLSLNKKWFLKVDRRPTLANPGKGCYWTLVPGTEEMFMENITQAGGHHRKYHDVGLTAELSRGHSNNIIVRQQQHNSPGSGDIKKTTRSSPVAPKLYKPRASSLAPMYSTFRMTSTTMESIAHDNTHCKKRTKLHHHDDNKTYDSFDIPAVVAPSTGTKRVRFDDDDDDDDGIKAQPRDYSTAVGDDAQSDCDSGVDVGNEHVGDKIKTNTSLVVPPSELTSTNEQVQLYNVLDHFLDQLPLPDQQNLDAFSSTQWDTNELHSYAPSSPPVTIPFTGALGFMNSCDIDPVLGYPPLNYYSANGFYYDNDGQVVSGADLKGIYPALLSSRFDRICGATRTMDENVDNSLMMMPATTVTTKAAETLENWRHEPQDYSSSQENVDPLLVHLNGGDCTGDEEIANTYLKFEDDDPVCASNPIPLADIGADETMDDGPTFMNSSGYQRDDYLSYPFTTMCGLLES